MTREVLLTNGAGLVLGANAERAEIIGFWHTVEMFSPPTVDRISRERRVYAAKLGEPLPWEPGHELAGVRLRKGQAWRHVVYVGVYSLEAVFEVLKRVFSPDEESFDERPAGESALAAFVVSDEGRPLLGSEVLSSCAWATGRVLHPGPGTPGWLTGFDGARAEFTALFEDLVAPGPDDERAEELRQRGYVVGRPIAADMLAKCHDAAAEVAKVDSALPHVEIRIRSEIVGQRSAYSTDGHDFLNSFIADDLATVASRVKSGKVGTALLEYLRPDADLDVEQRVEVRQQLDTVLDATAPRRVPLGRWPSKPGHPLALSQQLAVNTALEMLDAGAGIVGVNGPPGTGKTTMLRDLIAALVVERARRLAELPHPRDAFGGQRRWLTGERTRVVHLWKPQFTGFEIVVASANNGAVENVTNEIPAREAIDEQWWAEAAQLNYFPDIASALLNIDICDADDAEGGPECAHAAWALVAARLGNKKNRSRFVDAFWYRKPTTESARAGTHDAPSLAADAPGGDVGRSGLLAILKGYEATPQTLTWAESVAEFRRALGCAASVQADRDHAYTCLARKTRIEQDLRAAQQTMIAAQQRVAAARAQITEAEHVAQEWQAERERRVHQRTEHRQFRPGLLEWLLSAGKAMRDWRRCDQALAAKVTEVEQSLHTAHGDLTRLAREKELAVQAAAQCGDTLRRGERDLAAVTAAVDAAQSKLGAQFPDPAW